MPLVISSSYRLNSELKWPLGLASVTQQSRQGVPQSRTEYRDSVLGPRLWNSLPRLLHDTSDNTTSFGHSLKTFFLSEYYTVVHTTHYALWRLCAVQIYVLLTYLLTYITGEH